MRVDVILVIHFNKTYQDTIIISVAPKAPKTDREVDQFTESQVTHERYRKRST